MKLEEMSVKELKGMLSALEAVGKIEYPLWYGIPGIRFIYHNSWADPEIEYKGERCCCCMIEDTMWDMFRHETGSENPDEFETYMQENADLVYALCEAEINAVKW